jgi:hypothetical protein
VLRRDYAIFTGDRFSHNAMLYPDEAERMEREGLRCVDVEASMDASLPRFRDRVMVTSRGRFGSRWGR